MNGKYKKLLGVGLPVVGDSRKHTTFSLSGNWLL